MMNKSTINTPRPRVLVSGGTGFLGGFVVPLLRQYADVTLLSRTQPDCLKADLTQWDGGMNAVELRGRYDVFLHMAGLYDLRINSLQGYTQNVVGTHTALALAQKADIPHFIHISTVAVGIGAHGLVQTDKLDCLRHFPDHYSESKAAAEQMVRSWSGEAFDSRLILRLGVLIGDRNHGKILRVDGPYHAVHGVAQLLALTTHFPGPLPLPGHEGRSIPVVPVDCAADAIVRLLDKSWSEKWNGTRALHITPREGLAVRDLYASVLRHLGHEEREFRLMTHLPDWLAKPTAELVSQLPQEELEYLLNFPRYDSSETEALLGRAWCPEFPAYESAFWRGYEALISNR